jgi:molybdate transport system substrate-binding protein
MVVTMRQNSPDTPIPLRAISSMATRAVLAELAAGFETQSGLKVAIESVGGVDAAKRVAAGEAFDLVLLASDALDKLIAAGHVLPGRVDYVHSPVAIAVRAAGPDSPPLPDVGSEAALRAAVQAAATIGYSTGPSGQHLMRLFARWGLADELASRTVQAKPGVPVGKQVASGEVALGFQQLSELQGMPGITIVGLLPDDCAFITTFSGGVAASSTQPDAARAFLAHLNSPGTADTKQRYGMTPVSA